jgi:hypothetical protein
MKKRRHTTRSTPIPSTGRGTGPAAFWAIATPGVVGTAISGTDTVGAVAGTADGMEAMVDGTVDMEADMEVGEDLEAGEDLAVEAGMAAAETFPGRTPCRHSYFALNPVTGTRSRV